MDWAWWTVDMPPDPSQPQRKQNLIIILEESKYYHIHNKIITFFMNRLLIDEDAAFECLGTCTLDYKDFVLRSYNMRRDEQLKIENDQRQILELINKAADFENEEYDTHFILGSNFYTSPDPQNI